MKVHKYQFCIPSYRRAENQKTLKLLHQIGVPQEQITLSVQTEEDVQEYTKAGVKDQVGTFLYRKGKCAADNRNTLLDHFENGTKIILLEDDIASISRLCIDPLTKIRRLSQVSHYDEIVALCDYGFMTAKKCKTIAFGLNLYRNPMFMREKYNPRAICDTSFFGLINSEERFDNECFLLDDTDMCARIIKKYGAFVSIQNYATQISRFSPGGCHEQWAKAGNKAKAVRIIAKRHADIFDFDLRKENSITLKKGSK